LRSKRLWIGLREFPRDRKQIDAFLDHAAVFIRR
jgi:hypothetical protein